jgi:CRP-like cAMP-binding protein
MTHHRSNFLLNRLSPRTMALLEPRLSVVSIDQGVRLSETDEPLAQVYFPLSGVLSCVVEMIGGSAIETGMIGRDGVYGATQALDNRKSLMHVGVQVKCSVSKIDASAFSEIALQHPELRKLVLSYEEFFVAQVQQTAACNALHTVRQRLAKWLLRMHHLAGPDLPLTQEFLAQMMGVQRSSVSGHATELQASGAISYNRGHIRILDLAILRRHACECNDDINAHFDQVFGSGDQGLPSLVSR